MCSLCSACERRRSQKANMSDVCPLGVWPLAARVPTGIATPLLSNYQLLQYAMLAKIIPFKSCNFFILQYSGCCPGSSSDLTDSPTHFEYSRRIVFIRRLCAFGLFVSMLDGSLFNMKEMFLMSLLNMLTSLRLWTPTKLRVDIFVEVIACCLENMKNMLLK